MNYHNFDRLVAYLQDLIVIGPETFNYSRWKWTDSGCLACHCRVLSGDFHLTSSLDDIQGWLNCTTGEALYLFSERSWGMFGKDLQSPLVGVPGIREALRRLAILATRYERPAVAGPVKADPMPSSLRQTLDALTRGETVTTP